MESKGPQVGKATGPEEMDMKRNELKEITTKYGLKIRRNPITDEAFGVYTDAKELIPELDAIADSTEPSNVQVERRYAGGEYQYLVTAPTNWFDLYGWVK